MAFLWQSLRTQMSCMRCSDSHCIFLFFVGSLFLEAIILSLLTRVSQIEDRLSVSHRDQLAMTGIRRHVLPLPSPEIVTALLNRELDRVRAAFLNPQDDEVRRRQTLQACVASLHSAKGLPLRQPAHSSMCVRAWAYLLVRGR